VGVHVADLGLAVAEVQRHNFVVDFLLTLDLWRRNEGYIQSGVNVMIAFFSAISNSKFIFCRNIVDFLRNNVMIIFNLQLVMVM
jgi:hypothetical protein